jgi:hypothetical protein
LKKKHRILKELFSVLAPPLAFTLKGGMKDKKNQSD